jgi:uncharacterized membrane protein YphA (DoxX/SURF4 family)
LTAGRENLNDHLNSTACHPHFISSRRTPDLASQQILGICSEWSFRFARFDFNYSFAYGPPLKMKALTEKGSLKDVAKKLEWLPQLLARMVISFVFLQAGWNKLQNLSHSKDVLNSFGIGVPSNHLWDPFFPALELLCATFVLLGVRTSFMVLPLVGTLLFAFFNLKFKELAGLDLSVIQGFGMMILLAGLCLTGSGSFSLDRLRYKQVSVAV